METINVSYKVTYFSSVVVQIDICCYRQKFNSAAGIFQARYWIQAIS